VKITMAQENMLLSFKDANDRGFGLAYTSDLGPKQTWYKLHDLGLVKGGRLTDLGRKALKDRGYR
jgi:hypothetical protein